MGKRESQCKMLAELNPSDFLGNLPRGTRELSARGDTWGTNDPWFHPPLVTRGPVGATSPALPSRLPWHRRETPQKKAGSMDSGPRARSWPVSPAPSWSAPQGAGHFRSDCSQGRTGEEGLQGTQEGPPGQASGFSQEERGSAGEVEHTGFNLCLKPRIAGNAAFTFPTLHFSKTPSTSKNYT